MSDSTFDPNLVLNQPITGAMDTKFITVPPGEYVALVKDVKARSGTIRNGDRAGERYLAVDLLWQIDDPKVKEATGLDTNIVKQGLMIDLTPQNGIDLGKGKNVRLGRLRAALDMNRPDQPFTFEGFRGRIAKIAVTNRTDDRPDSPTKGDTFADVSAVAPNV